MSVYWTNLNGGTVMKVALAGGNPVTLASGQVNPLAVAVGAADVYWTTSTGTVMKAPIAGGAAVQVAAGPSGLTSFTGLAADATSVYWATNDSILKAPVGGGAPVQVATGQNTPTSVAVDGASVDWTYKNTGEVMSALRRRQSGEARLDAGRGARPRGRQSSRLLGDRRRQHREGRPRGRRRADDAGLARPTPTPSRSTRRTSTGRPPSPPESAEYSPPRNRASPQQQVAERVARSPATGCTVTEVTPCTGGDKGST